MKQRLIYWLALWSLPRARIVRVRQAELTDETVNDVLAGMNDQHLVWRVLMQLLDEAEREAWDAAGARMDNANLGFGYVGGAKHLGQFRDDLEKRRELGRARRAKTGGGREG